MNVINWIDGKIDDFYDGILSSNYDESIEINENYIKINVGSKHICNSNEYLNSYSNSYPNSDFNPNLYLNSKEPKCESESEFEYESEYESESEFSHKLDYNILINFGPDEFVSYCELNSSKFDNLINQWICTNEKYSLVKILIRYYYPIDNNILNISLMSGNISQVQILLDLGCNWTIYSFSFGTQSNNLDFIKWIRTQGCFWGIVHKDHRENIRQNKIITKWLSNNKCPWI